MARSICNLLLVVAVAVSPVYGGSRAWENSINYDQIIPIPFLGDSTVRMSDNSTQIQGNSTTLRGNSTVSHTKIRRWITVNPGDESADSKLWPGGVIRYCFAEGPHEHGGRTKTTREVLFEDLRQARDLWWQSGLQEGFGWEEADDVDCVDRTKRPDLLFILYSNQGKMATTPGKPALRNDGVGPRMILSDSEMGMLNIVANYAHEMGHAWGMHHEHQNQRFWGLPYSEAGGTLFGVNNWNCKNLKDYETVYQRILKYHNQNKVIADKDMETACRKRSAAEGEKFSAAEYLPIVEDPVLASNKDIDWDSIMLYPSGAGALGSAAGGVDNRQVILSKPNGERIAPNLRPSPRDVIGLQKLYEYKSSSKWTALGDTASKVRGVFKNIRKKEPDSGC